MTEVNYTSQRHLTSHKTTNYNNDNWIGDDIGDRFVHDVIESRDLSIWCWLSAG